MSKLKYSVDKIKELEQMRNELKNMPKKINLSEEDHKKLMQLEYEIEMTKRNTVI